MAGTEGKGPSNSTEKKAFPENSRQPVPNASKAPGNQAEPLLPFASFGYSGKVEGGNIPAFFLKEGIQAAIFDIDGTLLDSMPFWDNLGAIYLEKCGKKPENGLRDILFPMTIAESVHYLKTVYHLPFSEDEIRDGLSETALDFYKDEVPLKKGAGNFVRAFSKAGLPMALCTIGEASLETAALKRLGILDLFQGMFLCEDYGTTKREPDIYRICARSLSASPAHTLVVEDTLQTVSSAKKGGFPTAAVEDAASSKKRKQIFKMADYYFTDFTALYIKGKPGR